MSIKKVNLSKTTINFSNQSSYQRFMHSTRDHSNPSSRHFSPCNINQNYWFSNFRNKFTYIKINGQIIKEKQI